MNESEVVIWALMIAGSFWLVQREKRKATRRKSVNVALAIIDKWESRLSDEHEGDVTSLKKVIAMFKEAYERDENDELIQTRAEYVVSDFDRWAKGSPAP